MFSKKPIYILMLDFLGGLYICGLIMLTVRSSIERTLRFGACMTLFVPLSSPSLYVKGFVVKRKLHYNKLNLSLCLVSLIFIL